jgi:hypothetical protein
MTSGKITRRIFLRTIAWLSILGITRPDRVLADLGTCCPADITPDCFFKHRESAAIIGREYLKGRPGEADAEVLIELLPISPSVVQKDSYLVGPEDFSELLRHHIRLDFEKGHVVKVHGWLLSETEARLCALALYPTFINIYFPGMG